ncbi:MAG: trypsin-like peptidase domain-containing protein [Alphaproteobacteria bacterium]|nr:trypsin-like peptidase domain-containing protein [Alphaproteobacteria bacterium]
MTTSKGLGSGFVIDSSGYVVTNNHVVATSTEAEVRFADGSKFKARLIGRDEATDIALLKIDAPKAFPSVKFDDDRKVRVGDWVLAVGNPFGLGGTVTAGILSARGRDEVGSGQFTDYLQVDAAINPGNSGGPTFDTNGRVIGMNSMGLSNRTGETAGGIGFAIPSTTIQRVVEDLKTSGSVSRGFIGVQIESLTEDAAKALGLPNANGALVTDVIEGGPAQLAGIKRGDVILKINGQSVKDNRELSRKIAALVVGQSAVFTIWRETKQIAISVTAIKRERIADAGDILNRAENPEVRLTSLGLGLRTITPQIRDIIAPRGGNVAGVVITDLDLSSDAAQRGLRPGDRIVAVGGADVSSMGDVNLAVEQAKSLKRPMVLLFVITQAGATTHVAVKFNTP